MQKFFSLFTIFIRQTSAEIFNFSPTSTVEFILVVRKITSKIILLAFVCYRVWGCRKVESFTAVGGFEEVEASMWVGGI